jgi:hypothetical protein
LRRYWETQENGNLTATLTFQYLDEDGNTDIPPGVPEDSFELFRISGGTLTPITFTQNTTANTVTAAGITDFADWALISPLAPTSAGVSVGGRVLTFDGRGIPNTRVTFADTEGNIRSAVTNSFGYFRVEGLSAGSTFAVSAAHRIYRFESRAVTPTEDMTGIDFIAIPEGYKRE